jgi:hypothetical protein
VVDIPLHDRLDGPLCRCGNAAGPAKDESRQEGVA